VGNSHRITGSSANAAAKISLTTLRSLFRAVRTSMTQRKRQAGTRYVTGCPPTVGAADGNGMILIKRRVAIDDATYRVG
jgi:hypothetical protein